MTTAPLRKYVMLTDWQLALYAATYIAFGFALGYVFATVMS